MKKALLLSFIVLSALAQAGPVTKEWKNRYKQVTAAISSKNLKAFKAIFALEFKIVAPDGKVITVKEFLASVEPMFKSKSIAASEKLKSVTKTGDVYDVTFDMTITMMDKAGKKSTYHEAGIDSWKKIGGKWLMIKTFETISENN